MTQHYRSEKRARDPHALPDLEIFHAGGPGEDPAPETDDGTPGEPGWYWWSCSPGCLPDGEASGPFDSEADALADAREGFDDDDDDDDGGGAPIEVCLACARRACGYSATDNPCAHLAPKIEIPPPDDDRRLRHVRLGSEPYTLILWDTYRTEGSGRFGTREILGYALLRDGEADPIFVAEDYYAPAIKTHGRALDGDHTLRDLLGFLTLRPGDTDDDYFASYTPRQRAFAENEAEALAFYSDDDPSDPDPAYFVNLDEWEPSNA